MTSFRIQPLKRALAAFALSVPLFAAAGPAYAAEAPPSTPQVQWVHNVKATDDAATLLAKYRCWGGNEGTHLWVSLKQGGGIDGKSAEQLAGMEGTSALAASWYDSHPTGVVCDGKWQIQQFTVARQKGELSDGAAFLQFCLFDNAGQLGYRYEFVDVKAR